MHKVKSNKAEILKHDTSHKTFKDSTPSHREYMNSYIQDNDDSNTKKSPINHVATSPQTISKTPQKHNNKSISNQKSQRLYRPYDRHVRQFQIQKKNLYEQLQHLSTFRITNPQSYFLNEKYPKPPLYQRAQQIVKQRQQALKDQRERRVRQKQQQMQHEYQQMKTIQSQRKLKKQQAYELTNKLYKDHYSKINKLQLYKIQLQKQQSKLYREKPLINKTSRQIYNGFIKKNKMQINIIDRFSQYDQQKQQHQKDIENQVNSKYYPFKPNVSPSPSKRQLKSMSQSNQKHQSKSNINLKIKGNAP